MKYAVYALCVNAHKHSHCAECESVQQLTSDTETEDKQTPASSDGLPLLFQHFLSECQLHLQAVPSILRLELLENIFSLLFLSTADFSPHIHKDSNSSPLKGNASQSECLPETRNTDEELGAKERTENDKEKQKLPKCNHLELGHFIQGCRGFLADVTAMTGFLKLLKEGLEGMSVEEGKEATEGLGCSITAETFAARLQRLSKRTAEAQWRLQIISSNQSSGSGETDQTFL
ncbi:zinc finger FYVE domain-containing protein 26-like [Notothenia coriiceps]|uniref:Zinc finger FYVE domain-containing protein 26-like n=1 Tax=Notothenia coriiceps TaxID=8208 RepID=A0A6I9Q6L9_9TELE|nr:PREDICTED: zinc finger FYVE domain-containing protein 26-like [Notothenia coriiceps]